MVKLGLKDAYMTDPDCKEHQGYLQFLWEQEVYQYVCLPFRLSSSLLAFTKLFKSAVVLLRSLGFRLVIYLDDIILLDQCKKKFVEGLFFVKRLLLVLGFVINELKSSETPLQIMEYLMVDSVSLKIPTRE